MRAPAQSGPAKSFAALVPAMITVLATAIVVALPALAYQYPLSSTEIRSAYMLGNRKDAVRRIFSRSTSTTFPCPIQVRMWRPSVWKHPTPK
jgi:hypothetical protein